MPRNRISCPSNRSKQVVETHTAYGSCIQYTLQSLNENNKNNNNNIHGFTDNKLLCVKPCMLFFIQTLPRIICAGVRIWPSPITESPLSIDIIGIKRDLDKKHWCISHYLTRSSMDARTPNLGDSVFPYIGAISHVSFLDLFGPIAGVNNPYT